MFRNAILLAAGAAALGCATAPSHVPDESCVPRGEWVSPTNGKVVSAKRVLTEAARADVVLLGEGHTLVADHQWQLHTLAALQTKRKLVIGLEMFPRRAQPALDRWVAGTLTRAEFLEQSEWSDVWGFDAELYMPIFDFARMHNIPMVALNVDRSIVSTVGDGGWDSLSESQRNGLAKPADPQSSYLVYLAVSWSSHLPEEEETASPPLLDFDDPDFRNFVEAQTLWDRAMAEAIYEAQSKYRGRLITGLMGEGHVIRGWGVAHQLADLGVHNVELLLPWDIDLNCVGTMQPDLADAVFGVVHLEDEAPARPRLGVQINETEDGISIREVTVDSVAEAAGLQKGDIIQSAAGVQVAHMQELIEIILRQAPGTWLPLTVLRGDDTLDIVAKFPHPAVEHSTDAPDNQE